MPACGSQASAFATSAGKTVTPEVLKHEFESRVRGIGHIVSLLSPWDAPLNLTRIWCAYWCSVTNFLREVSGRLSVQVRF